MRAVALSDAGIQARIEKSFVPLKVSIAPGTPEFPLEWPAMLGWRIAYGIGGGKDNQGFTGCSVVSPDLRVEYGNTGSAMVWELFDSSAYDAAKFGAMLDRSLTRFRQEEAIRADGSLAPAQRARRVAEFRRQVGDAVRAEGPFRMPPPGFTVEGARRLFRMSGDLKDGG